MSKMIMICDLSDETTGAERNHKTTYYGKPNLSQEHETQWTDHSLNKRHLRSAPGSKPHWLRGCRQQRIRKSQLKVTSKVDSQQVNTHLITFIHYKATTHQCLNKRVALRTAESKTSDLLPSPPTLQDVLSVVTAT
ncbi:hypothetical protein L798_03227 [Zootermopsis nevadensis]|uniref:Uncharacterized protein n=1 Tax=Zootermopsis nevadensis TaxID=136037 RepID=A0A067QIV8_ZOONE|nr:hypothetical protein L798_03227 [Zootermopsis nevadensis]